MIANGSCRRLSLFLGLVLLASVLPVYCEQASATPEEEAAARLMEKADWKQAASAYCALEIQFPKSDILDRFVYFQGLAAFKQADYPQAIAQFKRFLTTFPHSPLTEQVVYHLALAEFKSFKRVEFQRAAADYLKRFPDGKYAGDMLYRLADIDFNNREVDRTDKIISDINAFLASHPDDAAKGSLLCLLGDIYKQKAKANEDKALETYTKAVWSQSPDDEILHALDSATYLLEARKDWDELSELHEAFVKFRPASQLVPHAAVQWAQIKIREGKRAEAREILAKPLADHIADPTNEQVEFLIDELVKSLVPCENGAVFDLDELDKQLVEILNRSIANQKNQTTSARVDYARARLHQLAKNKDRADQILKGIATLNAKDPSPLSPALLASSGDILLKLGDLDGAEAMYKRLRDHFPNALNGDAGVVGLGYVALARKNPDAALELFEKALKKPNNSSFQEASLGKLQSLIELDQLEAAEILAGNISAGGKKYRAVSAAKAMLQLARIYRKQAAKLQGEQARDLMKKAHTLCIRVFITWKGFTDISAEGIWEASQIAGELGDEKLRKKNLNDLLAEPKFKGNEFFDKAAKQK